MTIVVVNNWRMAVGVMIMVIMAMSMMGLMR